MTAPNREKQLLIEALVREASDIDLMCYLARTEGPAIIQDLLECIADAHALSEEDLFYNLQTVLKKKREAAHPQVLHRRPPAVPDQRHTPRAGTTNGAAAVH